MPRRTHMVGRRLRIASERPDRTLSPPWRPLMTTRREFLALGASVTLGAGSEDRREAMVSGRWSLMAREPDILRAWAARG
jgi:hypothetical protein